MKKTTLFAAVACAALLSFHTDALDLTLKNGRELPNVTIVNTAKNRVTLVTTASNGVSTLRSIRFSEFSDQSLNALKQYFMENINSYMEPAFGKESELQCASESSAVFGGAAAEQ